MTALHVVRDPLRETDLPRGCVGTIGNFDGVHLGHRRILEAVVARARETRRPSIAITFEPHPLAVLRPDRAPRRLRIEVDHNLPEFAAERQRNRGPLHGRELRTNEVQSQIEELLLAERLAPQA